MKKWFGIAVMVMALVFTSFGISYPQELPCGFAKIKTICETVGVEDSQSVWYFVVTSKDTSPYNAGGMIEYAGASGPAGTGFGRAVKLNTGRYASIVIVFWHTDGRFSRSDFLNQSTEELSKDDACALANTFLEAYSKVAKSMSKMKRR
jgi:hypothetical protein